MHSSLRIPGISLFSYTAFSILLYIQHVYTLKIVTRCHNTTTTTQIYQIPEVCVYVLRYIVTYINRFCRKITQTNTNYNRQLLLKTEPSILVTFVSFKNKIIRNLTRFYIFLLCIIIWTNKQSCFLRFVKIIEINGKFEIRNFHNLVEIVLDFAECIVQSLTLHSLQWKDAAVSLQWVAYFRAD